MASLACTMQSAFRSWLTPLACRLAKHGFDHARSLGWAYDLDPTVIDIAFEHVNVALLVETVIAIAILALIGRWKFGGASTFLMMALPVAYGPLRKIASVEACLAFALGLNLAYCSRRDKKEAADKALEPLRYEIERLRDHVMGRVNCTRDEPPSKDADTDTDDDYPSPPKTTVPKRRPAACNAFDAAPPKRR
jgi:hypothetical protein